MSLWAVVRRIHNSIRAYFVKRYRTQEVLKAFKVAHSVELKDTPVNNWPIVRARQDQEIAAVRAGKLDIVDRKSWTFPFLPACYDSETEMLTRRGFVYGKDLTKGDVLATRTPDGAFEWQVPDEIIRQRYKGPMIEFLGEQIDGLVTPNHRMVVRFARKKRNRIVDVSGESIKLAAQLYEDPLILAAGGSDALPSNHRICHIPLRAKPLHTISASAAAFAIPRSIRLEPLKRKFDQNSRALDIPTHVWIQFMALYLADGSCAGTAQSIDTGVGDTPYDRHIDAYGGVKTEFAGDPFAIADKHPHNKFRVRITCKDTSPIRQEVADLLNQMPVTWTASDQGFACGSKALWMELFPLGNSYSKHVPEMIKNLSFAGLRQFVDWLKKTDGTEYPNGYGEYGTVSKALAMDVVTILIRLGYSVHTREIPQESGAVYTRINFGPREYGNVQSIREVKYNGYVFCPSVPNGVVCVRRNGKVYWCGNSVTRLAIPILKSTPYNLRRCSRTPVPRRAINLIKGSVISQPWAIEPIKDTKVDDEDEQKERIKIAEKVFHHPNNQDSFQSFLETGIEDMCILGAWAFELRYTMDIKRPLKLWSVMIESVRIFPSWSESLTDMPHYAQMTGLKGERGALIFYDDEMAYVKDNPATDSPFGLGKMEVGFQSIISFLGIQDMSGRAGTDQVHKTWLWFEQPQADSSYQILRRHIQNELEGQAKVSIIGGMKKPDVVEIQPVVEEDLLLNWQEMLIRMIANSFDMSAMALGIEHDINRAVGSVLDDKDFRSAVVPMARRLQEAFTRKILHEKLGWYDLQFRFLQLDDPDIETKSDLCARMYSANALTPNQFRKKMGDEPLESPMADLTQAEQMMLNMETMARVQEASTQRMTQFQDEHAASMPGIAPQVPPGMPPPQAPQPGQAQQPPRPGQTPGAQPPPGGQQQTAPGSPLRITPGNVARGGQIQSPKPMTTPKFPILGSKYNAKDIARMPVNQLTDVWMSGQLGKSPSKVMGEMMNQDPGILEEMTEEVKQFFDQVMQEEQDKPKKKLPLKVLHKWEKDQVTRFRRDAKRIADFATWLQKRGVFMGRPGGAPATKGNITQGGQVFKPGTTNSGRPGKPGNNNPIQRW